MTEAVFQRIGATAAVILAISSILYAVSFLAITPADQRKDDADKFFQSFADKPAGRQLANVFFVTGGLAGAWAVFALSRRLQPSGESGAMFISTVGVVANLASAAYGFWNLSRLHELSKLYTTAANRPAIEVAFHQPAPLDPLGVFRFAGAGLVVALFGLLILKNDGWPRLLGWLGILLGIDMLVLFAVSWAGSGALTVLTGALASLIMLPVFWCWAGFRMWSTIQS